MMRHYSSNATTFSLSPQVISYFRYFLLVWMLAIHSLVKSDVTSIHIQFTCVARISIHVVIDPDLKVRGSQKALQP